jgi:transposase
MAEKAARAEAKMTALETLNAAADARIARLTSMLKSLERARYGKRSEKLGPDAVEQHSFVFEEIETGIAALQADHHKTTGAARSPALSRPRKGFAAHLERFEEVIEPEIPAEYLGLEKIRIGEDASERLDVIPARFRVIVTRRPKYAFRGIDGVIQAAAPNHIIEGGIPTEALLALIAVSKYADGQPLYRQAAIYARDGVELDRSLTPPWMGRIGFELEPLAEHLMRQVKQAERVFADETVLPTLAPGTGKTKTAYLWAYARTTGPSEAMVRRWSSTTSRTVEPGVASIATLRAIVASCRSTATAPIGTWRSRCGGRTTGSCSPGVGPTSVASSSNSTPMANPRWRRSRSNA